MLHIEGNISLYNQKNCENLIMKAIRNFVAVIALSTISFGTFAATEVQRSQGQSMGTVSATGFSLDDLQSQLAEKANAAGAKSFRIISTNGGNQLRGVAELYN